MITSAILYIVSLVLLYSTSMQGMHLVGTDIQSEYYIATKMINGWDINYPHLYNASVSTSVIVPWISRTFNIDIVWIFKAIFPAIFAVVTVILYHTYRKFIGNTGSVYAVLYFMAMPVFFLEMPQLPRQEISEVFLCLMILALASDWKYKSVVIILCPFFCIILHFTLGLVAVTFLVAILLVKLAAKLWKWNILQNSKVSFKTIVIAILLSIIIGSIWSVNIAGGLPLRSMSNIITVVQHQTISTNTNTTPESNVQHQTISTNTNTTPESKITNKTIVSDGMIAAATGTDFLGVSVLGIIFRVIQWIIQLLIIVGCVRVLFNNKYKFTTDYLAGIAVSVMLLIACIFLFGFSSLLGITRFYHIALIQLAPMIIVGSEYISNLLTVNI